MIIYLSPGVGKRPPGTHKTCLFSVCATFNFL